MNHQAGPEFPWYKIGFLTIHYLLRCVTSCLDLPINSFPSRKSPVSPSRGQRDRGPNPQKNGWLGSTFLHVPLLGIFRFQPFVWGKFFLQVFSKRFLDLTWKMAELLHQLLSAHELTICLGVVISWKKRTAWSGSRTGRPHRLHHLTGRHLIQAPMPLGSMDIEIHHSFAESTHVGKGIIHWFLTWFLWEDIQKSKMSGPCRTCCSVVLLGRSTKGSGIRLSRRFAGLTAGLSTYHVGACQTCESQKSRFEGLKIRDRYSDFFLCCFFRNYCSHWKRLGTGMPKWLWQKTAPVPAVKQNPFGIGMGFTPPDSLFKPDFLIEKKYLSLELDFDQLQHSMFSNAIVLPCSHLLAKKVLVAYRSLYMRSRCR